MQTWYYKNIFLFFTFLYAPMSHATPPHEKCTYKQTKIIADQKQAAYSGMTSIAQALQDTSDPNHKLSRKLSKKWFGKSDKAFLKELNSNISFGLSKIKLWDSDRCVIRNDGQFLEEDGEGEYIDLAGDTIAYVNTPKDNETIYFTPTFFDLANTGDNSLIGLIVHEVMHFDMASGVPYVPDCDVYNSKPKRRNSVEGTCDFAYGREASSQLAPNTALAKRNSSNYQYYFEDFLSGKK